MSVELDRLLGEAEGILEKQEAELSHAEIPVQEAVRERISKIQLCQTMIRNIRMNMTAGSTTGLQLRYNQLNAVSGLIKFLQDEGGEKFKGRFKQPTGSGKTVLFGVITKLIGLKTLVLVPKQNLLAATMDEFVTMVGMDPNDIGLVGAGSYEIGKQITIATYQSHMKKMKKDKAYREEIQKCDVIICDEAHRSLGDKTKESIDEIDAVREDEEAADEMEHMEEEEENTDEIELTEEEQAAETEALKNLSAITNKQSLKLAFTATPTLANKDVADEFPYLIAEEKQSDLVKAGILVGYRIIQVGAEQRVDDFEGYMTEEQEADVLEREKVYGKLTKEYADALKNYRDKKSEADYPLYGVAFCVNIAECDKYAKEAELNGLKARVVTGREAKGKKGDKAIKQAEQDLLDGVIDQIVTVNKLGEGWNFKPANAAVWARASTSPMIVIQGIGRTGRSYVDEQGRVKPFSYVFETKWSLRDSFKDGRYKKQPLTIAQALQQNGEDPNDICSMENGKQLELEHFFLLDPDTGVTTIDGVEYVEADRYCSRTIGLTKYGTNTMLLNWGVEPVETPHPVLLRGRIMTCYLKSAIDKKICETVFVPPSGIATMTLPDGSTKEVVYLREYLKGKAEKPHAWMECANDEGLQNIPGISAYFRPEGAKVRLSKIDVYDRKEVDALLQNMQFLGNKKELKFDVEMSVAGKGVEIEDEDEETGKRTAVHIRYMDEIPKGMMEAVIRKMEEMGIKPIQKKIYGKNGMETTMHWKDEVERAIDAVKADVAKEARKDREKKEADIQLRRDEEIRKAQDKKKQLDANTESIVQPQEQTGVFYIKYKLPVQQGKKIIEGEGLAVDIDEYVPESLGRKLTNAEKQIVRQGLRSIPKMMYNWKKDVDEKISRL